MMDGLGEMKFAFHKNSLNDLKNSVGMKYVSLIHTIILMRQKSVGYCLS